MPDPASPPPSQPPEIEVPFHGGVRKIPLADAPKLLGIALQDEHRRTELQRAQAELKAQADAQSATLKVGQELANFARGNPAAARALDQVYASLTDGSMTPEQVFSRLRGGGSESLETNGAAVPNSPPVGDAQTRAALETLAEELRGVKSEVQRRGEADKAAVQKTEIDNALAADAYLRSHPGAAKVVRALLAPHLAAGLSIQEAVALETTNVKGVAIEVQTAERDRLQAQSTLGSPPPSAGVPPVTAPDLSKMPADLTAEDRKRWMRGQIKEQSKNLFSAIQRAAVSGPS